VEFLRHSKIIAALWLFLAAMILNYSIDIPDPHGDSVEEDLSYNDVESVTELIFEYCLGWDNFVPEHDDDDRDDEGGFAKKIEVAFVIQAMTFEAVPESTIPSTGHYFRYAISAPEPPFLAGVHKPPQA
jgi:hypothetical protein